MKYFIDEFGFVRETDTRKIITVLGNPSRRQRLRYWSKNFQFKVPKWLEDWGAAAAYAIYR